MTSGQQREDDHERTRPGREQPLASSRTTEPPERSDQQAVSAFEHDRRKRNGDHRQRVALEASARFIARPWATSSSDWRRRRTFKTGASASTSRDGRPGELEARRERRLHGHGAYSWAEPGVTS
jgi:hypothetical protein